MGEQVGVWMGEQVGVWMGEQVGVWMGEQVGVWMGEQCLQAQNHNIHTVTSIVQLVNAANTIYSQLFLFLFLFLFAQDSSPSSPSHLSVA